MRTLLHDGDFVEEAAAAHFAAGFRPFQVFTRFLEHQMGRPVCGSVPVAIGAPSHTHGLSFTSPRTFLTEAVVETSGQGRGGRGGGGEGRKRSGAVHAV